MRTRAGTLTGAVASRTHGTFGVNNVGSLTSVVKAPSAAPTISPLYALSFSGPSVGSPHTYSILLPLTTRGAPVVRARENMAEIMATGIPAFSISFATVAPQRLQVPQVATRSAPSTSFDFNSSAIAAPILRASATAVPTPLVVRTHG